ncbi:MAG: hypothetical protein OXG22_12295, partial [Chloroflexi bacterium]|nr:hypothetical protein [Chloroflexota bacterium]
PTGPVTLTVKAVDHQNNANAETGRVAFSLSDFDWVTNRYKNNYTDDELTVTINPEDFWYVQTDEGPVRRGNFALYVKPRVNNECVDITHTLSGGGYGSVTMETMRIHLPPSTGNITSPCQYLDAELWTVGRVPGYVWMDHEHDLTGSRPVAAGRSSPIEPPRGMDGQPQIRGGPGDENGNPYGDGGSNAPPSDAVGSNAPPSDSDGSSAPPQAQGSSGGGLPQLVEGGESATVTLRLATVLEGDEQVRVLLRTSGATPGEDYTLTLDGASSPGVSVSSNQPLSSARSLLTFSAGADRAVLTLTALADGVAENEQLTVELAGSAYFDGVNDAVEVPVKQSLTFAIVDGPDPEVAEVEKLILEMIERHRNVTGNATALANWEKALRTIRGEEGGFTIEELEEHAASVPAGKPRERWALVLKVAKKLDAERQQAAQQVTPEISVTAGDGITEGGNASFTVTASPAPSSPLSVSVTVSQSGDYAASGTTGAQTVTIPTSGSMSHTVATVNDDIDEADGSVTLTLNAGDGYTIASGKGTAAVDVTDDDAAAQAQQEEQSCVTDDADLLAEVEAKTKDPWNGARPDLLEMFTRSYNTMKGDDDYTVADVKARPDKQEPNWQGDGPNELWQKIYKELDRLEACREASSETEEPTPTPEVSVTAGGGITEGGNASFIVTASPTPTSALTVTLTVSQTGDYGVSTGTKSVTIPTSGSVSHAVATMNDDTDEANGSVTVTLNAGSGYTVSSQGTASVSVADDDDPPPATPEVSVTGGSGITEGGNASFAVTASPAPSSALTVTITVTQNGDYGVSTGSTMVEIPTTGSVQHTVATTGDSVDEADGSVTVTLNTGSGYTVSSSQGTASVTVS